MHQMQDVIGGVTFEGQKPLCGRREELDSTFVLSKQASVSI